MTDYLKTQQLLEEMRSKGNLPAIVEYDEIYKALTNIYNLPDKVTKVLRNDFEKPIAL
jgi:hypothetical protein